VKAIHYLDTIHVMNVAILKPIWTYRTELWLTASISNLARDSGRSLVFAEYGYLKGSPTPTVKEEIRCYSSQYSACLRTHPNDLIVNFMALPDNR
jgi:hypothetical protein